MPEGIQQKGQDNRNRKGYDQSVQTQYQCIFDRGCKIRGFKEPFKIIQPHPGASPYTRLGIVSPECQLDTIHRYVTEYKCQYNTRDTEQPERYVPPQRPYCGSFLSHLSRFHTFSLLKLLLRPCAIYFILLHFIHPAAYFTKAIVNISEHFLLKLRLYIVNKCSFNS